jgi:hypothetical protein
MRKHQLDRPYNKETGIDYGANKGAKRSRRRRRGEAREAAEGENDTNDANIES